MDSKETGAIAAFWIYKIGSFATFAYLTAMDSADFNAWNWLILIPINIFLGIIWPIYWGILHWIM
ncbi:hypothetical protein [Oceaniglobus trochenteri]|uniref:hypothetical protein n=1 Tax=Oceaniglobus trochenteri TaxID=2763260 RepID=UPI001CFFBA5B|nr:hypothetical protein [Oceaniglobus trochenteri]